MRCTDFRYSHRFHTCLCIQDKGYLESGQSSQGTPHSICSRQGRISSSGCLDLCSHTASRHLLMSKYSKETHKRDIASFQCPHKFPLGTRRSIEESLGQQEVLNDWGRKSCKVEDQRHTQDTVIRMAGIGSPCLRRSQLCILRHRLHLQGRSLFQVLDQRSSSCSRLESQSKLHNYQGKSHL